MERVLIGGYPEPCLNISRENLPLWFENYRETYINRDIRDLELPLSTLRRYATMLEQTYQIQILYPYYINIGKRLVKTPKIYITDTGMLN